jgi:hypothetical protein
MLQAFLPLNQSLSITLLVEGPSPRVGYALANRAGELTFFCALGADHISLIFPLPLGFTNDVR